MLVTNLTVNKSLFSSHGINRFCLAGDSFDRSRSSSLTTNLLKAKTTIVAQLRPDQISPSFVQSRRFHADQLARDLRDLGQPSSFTNQISSSYYYSYGGPGTNLAASSQEACRLTNSFCARDYQCCSGKCRCVKWSVMGKMSCWKKCF